MVMTQLQNNDHVGGGYTMQGQNKDNGNIHLKANNTFHDKCIITFDAPFTKQNNTTITWMSNIEHIINTPSYARWGSKEYVYHSMINTQIHFIFETVDMSHISPQLLQHSNMLHINMKLQVKKCESNVEANISVKWNKDTMDDHRTFI